MPVWYPSDFQYTSLLHKTAILDVILLVCSCPRVLVCAILCLTAMLDFGSPHFFIHFEYYLLSGLRNYVFLCRLAAKWNLTQFYRFLAAILDFGRHFESFYSHIWYIILVELPSLHKMSSFQNIIFISRNSTNLPCFGGHLGFWRPF